MKSGPSAQERRQQSSAGQVRSCQIGHSASSWARLCEPPPGASHGRGWFSVGIGAVWYSPVRPAGRRRVVGVRAGVHVLLPAVKAFQAYIQARFSAVPVLGAYDLLAQRRHSGTFPGLVGDTAVCIGRVSGRPRCVRVAAYGAQRHAVNSKGRPRRSGQRKDTSARRPKGWPAFNVVPPERRSLWNGADAARGGPGDAAGHPIC